MSWTSRRAILGTVVVLGLVSFQLAQAQRVRPPILPPDMKPPVKVGPADQGDLHGITLPTEEDLKRKFREITELIRAQEWSSAVDRLQALLDRNDDVFAPVERVGADGKRSIHMVSVKAEASRLIGSLPRPGMDYYKLTFGPKALEELKAARADGDPQMLAQVMARYLYTDAGADATELFATYQLDRGNYSQAAICFERLFQRSGPQKLSPITLFKASLAFQYSGNESDRKNMEVAWKMLEGKTEELVLGSKTYPLADLKSYVAKRKSLALNRERDDRVLVGGDATRNAQAHGTTPFLEPRWKHSTVVEETTRNWITQALQALDSIKQPPMHGFSPLAATLTADEGKIPLMIYRSFWGIHARNVTAAKKIDPDTKKPEWQAGDIFWEAPSTWSMDRMIREPKHVGNLNQWLQNYVTSRVRPQILFENSVVGSLSTDNVRVYAIEDLQVPPHATHVPGRFGQPGVGQPGGPVGQAVMHNRLQAYELDSGKLLWEVGSVNGKGDLDDSFFLGAPLPLNGRLYILNEKDQELRLVCLDPTSGQLINKPQRLGDLREKIQTEVIRRYNAAHLAYGEGILVCPTNSGGLLGVDLLTNSLVWAYGYRDKAPEQPMTQPGAPPGMVLDPQGRWVPAPVVTNWMSTPPVIAGGKVIFTAPDASAVHCINLRDGSRVWKHPRKEGDLYLAGVFAGKALIVNKSDARLVDLETGTVLKTLETGVPSGIGIASKDVYYLPLARATKTTEPEICLIDMAGEGFVKAHTRSRKKEVPGNLLFYEGEVLSQSLTQVTAYPQLDVELANIDALLAKNDKDPEGLTRRGDLRLDKGDLGGAIEDLRTALASMTDKHPVDLKDRARAKLFESLTEYFQRDFDKAEKYIKEYEAMCSVVRPEMTGEALKAAQAEEKRRKGNFYCLVGRGKEGQKKLRDAFEAYMNFGALGTVDNEMMSVVDDPGVKTSPRVWAEGRISAMVARATKDELAPLEQLVAERWQKVQNADLETLRNFVNTFGSISTVGREARLRLAEKLLQDSGDRATVDAERHLSILRLQNDDPVMAARAVETLARLMTRKGLMEDAAHFYRVLGRDFSKVQVREGKTGQDFYNDLATDKRFLPYLDEPAFSFSGKVKSEEFGESHQYPRNLFQLEQDGEKLPYFTMQGRLVIYTDFAQLKLLNRETGEEIWTMNLEDAQFSRFAQHQRNPGLQPRFSFQNLGHLVLLQVGHMVFAIDATNKKEPRLWKKNLSASSGTPQIRHNPQTGMPMTTVDPRDGSTQVIYTDGWMQRLGRSGTLSPIAVPLLTSDALQGVDPISGQTLWVRNDLPKNSHIYSDEAHVFVIEMTQDGSTGATRVFRLHDGVTVATKDFSELYRNRLKMFGRTILTRDEDGRGVVLRLYDIVKGEDVWKGSFPNGSIVLQPECEDLAGVVEPTGRTTIVDLKTFKTVTLKESVINVTTGKVEKTRDGVRPEHLQKVQSAHLLRDGKDIFIAFRAAQDQQIIQDSLQSNLLPGSGLRGLPVNGFLYSFDRESGELNWFNNAENQMVVLDEFDRVPVVILTARYRKWINQFQGQQQQVVSLRSYDKKTGKLLADKEDQNMGRYQQFHTIRVDARGGKVDLLSYNLRWSHFLEGVGGGGQGGTPVRGGTTAPPRGPMPGVGLPGIGIGGGIGVGGLPVPPPPIGAPVIPPQIIEKRRIIRDRD